jgi:flagellar protein FliO/FliZ
MSSVLAASASAPRAVFAAPQTQAVDAMPGLASLAEVVFALLVVLALIIAVAWVARRMRVGGTSGSAIRILAETTLGAKERAVLLQVHGRQLLVGIGASSVTTLHVFDRAEVAEAVASPRVGEGVVAPERPSFQSLLRRGLGLR